MVVAQDMVDTRKYVINPTPFDELNPTLQGIIIFDQCHTG